MTHSEALSALGLSDKHTPTELRLAYKRAAFNAHPDRGGSTERLKLINAAYALLGGQAGAGFTVEAGGAHEGRSGAPRGAPMPREHAAQQKILFICRQCATVFVGGGLAVAACTQVLPDKSVCGGSIRRYDQPDPDPESERLRARMRAPGGKSTRYIGR